MKKILALVLVLLVVLALSVPLIAAAEESATAPIDTAQAVTVEPTEAPVVETATTEAQETEPGGIDLTPLLQALIGVLALVFTRYVIPWLKAHTTAEQLAKINYWTKVAVAAAEKAYGSGHGTEKLADATKFLKSKGIIIDEKIVDSLIQEMFESAKKSSTTADTTTTSTTAT